MNKIIQKNKAFVDVSLFILILVKIMQEIDHFARQQRVKLLNSQTMKKRLNIDVSAKVNKNENQFQKTDENSDKEKWQLKNDILYANKRIYILSEKLRNALFK